VNRGRAEEAFRWWLRGLASVGFIVILLAYYKNGQAPAALIFLIGSMFGLDGMLGLLKGRL